MGLLREISKMQMLFLLQYLLLLVLEEVLVQKLLLLEDLILLLLVLVEMVEEAHSVHIHLQVVEEEVQLAKALEEGVEVL